MDSYNAKTKFNGNLTVTETPTHYKNSISAGLGMEYAKSDKLTLRTGLWYTQGALNDKVIDPVIPDPSRFQPSIGIEYTLTPSLKLNLIGGYAFGLKQEYEHTKLEQDTLLLFFGARFN